jgi:hypothetical protein
MQAWTGVGKVLQDGAWEGQEKKKKKKKRRG